MRAIWVTEDSELDATGRVWQGTFSAQHSADDFCHELPVEEAIAAAAGADRWDADELDAALAERDEARRQAADPNHFGWFGTHPAAYRLHLIEHAPSPARAEDQAAARIPLPAGWKVDCAAEPADERSGT